jgi:hypothetical protein
MQGRVERGQAVEQLQVQSMYVETGCTRAPSPAQRDAGGRGLAEEVGDRASGADDAVGATTPAKDSETPFSDD